MLIIFASIAGCGAAPETGQLAPTGGAVGALVISKGCIAEPIGTNLAVLYFTVVNRGKEDEALVAVAVEGTDRSDLHRTVSRGGLAWMEATTEIAIPAGGSLAFAPGGNHVMVQDSAKHLRRGALVRVRLVFRRSGSHRFPMPVVAYRDLDQCVADASPRIVRRSE